MTLAAPGAALLDFLLGKLLRRSSDLGFARLVWFCASPGIAVLAFGSHFSVLVHGHHAASWQAPAFALALGTIFALGVAHDWIGFARYLPGTIAWLARWFLHRTLSAYSEHVIET
jgi:hypothetical protein